jgi:hypothetical protein
MEGVSQQKSPTDGEICVGEALCDDPHIPMQGVAPICIIAQLLLIFKQLSFLRNNHHLAKMF